MQALEAEQAMLERERRSAAARPINVSADAFPALDLDRQREIVASLVETVSMTKAPHEGARWSSDRLEVVWRL